MSPPHVAEGCALLRNCAVICLPIETIEFLVFAPSDARERSYIVHISLQPSSGPSLPARHFRHSPATHRLSHKPKPLFVSTPYDGAFLSRFVLQGYPDGCRTRLCECTPQPSLSPPFDTTMEFPCLPFPTPEESIRTIPQRLRDCDCPSRSSRSQSP